MASKFRTAYGEKLHPAQEFDHKKISFKRAGQKINIYDLIQASREDTEIYPTLEKYGMLPSIETAEQFMANRAKGFFAEFEKTMDKRDFHELQIKAEESWKSLPREIREKFHNNREEFMNEGLEWYNAELKKAQDQAEFNKIVNEQGAEQDEPKQ